MNPRRGRTASLVPATFALVAALALPSVAAADLDIAYKRVAGTVNEGAQASVTAVCPNGMDISGGGAEAGGKYGGVGLNSTYPGSDNSWTSFYDSHGGTVLIRSYAICVPGNALIDARERVGGGTERARCPSDRDLTGGGVYSSGSFDQTAIRQSVMYRYSNRRQGPPNRWQSNLENISQPPVNITSTTYAVCHKGLDMSYRREHEIAPKGKRSSLTVRCAADERVLGGGGAAASLQIFLIDSYPIDTNADDDKLPDNGWRAILDNLDTQREVIAAHAACVKP